MSAIAANDAPNDRWLRRGCRVAEIENDGHPAVDLSAPSGAYTHEIQAADEANAIKLFILSLVSSLGMLKGRAKSSFAL